MTSCHHLLVKHYLLMMHYSPVVWHGKFAEASKQMTLPRRLQDWHDARNQGLAVKVLLECTEKSLRGKHPSCETLLNAHSRRAREDNTNMNPPRTCTRWNSAGDRSVLSCAMNVSTVPPCDVTGAGVAAVDVLGLSAGSAEAPRADAPVVAVGGGTERTGAGADTAAGK